MGFDGFAKRPKTFISEISGICRMCLGLLLWSAAATAALASKTTSQVATWITRAAMGEGGSAGSEAGCFACSASMHLGRWRMPHLTYFMQRRAAASFGEASL